ncbi:MAG: nitric oxide synthase oxygenase, partial [Cyanobacteriota bacterium]|nr:nitric oxide synthase oxygenase [Cyanobacteriota bacterium]
GEVLMRIDALAQAAYLLLEGRLQVYGRSQDGGLVAIATLDSPGRLLGEQALLPGHRYRNADVIALEHSRVAELPPNVFHALLAADPGAQERLRRQGLAELRDRLALLGVGMEAGLVGDGQTGSVQIDPGARLLEAGRIPPMAYSIVAGRLAQRPPDGGSPALILGPGALVGVAELAAGQPCRHEVIAETATELLPIPPERLQPLLGGAESAGGLQALVALPGLGRVYRHRIVSGGELAVISEYSELPGGPVRVRQIPGRRRLEATRALPAGIGSETWLSADGRNQLLVEAPGGRLLGLAMDQSWPQLGELVAALLRDSALSPLQLQAFQASGELLLEAPEERVEPGSQVICACTGTTATRLRDLARQVTSLTELQRCSAAGTVCGGCLGRLPLFLDQPDDGRLCRLRTAPLAADVLQVRLESIDAQPLPPWQVGEHLQVDGLIDGRWVGRQYTLTAGDERHYELGVKREPGGVFSNWLAEAGPAALVRIGSPQGQLLPQPHDPRPLLYLVAGIGVTPAIAGCRGLHRQRRITVAYSFRGAAAAPYLAELRQGAAEGRFSLLENDSTRDGRLAPERWLERLAPLLQAPLEVVICGPEPFNHSWLEALTPLEGVEPRVESFAAGAGQVDPTPEPGSWRRSPAEMAATRLRQEERFGPCPEPVPVGRSCPLDELRGFLDQRRREQDPELDLERRLAEASAELARRGVWTLSHDELRFGAQLAWRQSERCVGRLYWQGLDLFDRRDLRRAADIAEALFEHLRFAHNDGDLRPAISVFDPGETGRAGPRIWNPQLLRYAGYRSSRGRQIGDPAQNALTQRLIDLGWRPSGEPFELLPLVIETPEEGPCLFELPADCRREVLIRHPRHGWLEQLGLRWYAVPAVSDMALDLAGVLFRLAPFNGWYLDTEIAARNFSDTNRFNLLPRVAEGLGLSISDDRSLWRDKAQLVLDEAVLHSFDQAGVKISDHHTIGHEFLEFCRAEQRQGRDPQAEWSWVVPPMSGSLNVLYQEPFDNQALKPAFVVQPPAWAPPAAGAAGGAATTTEASGGAAAGRCPFSG